MSTPTAKIEIAFETNPGVQSPKWTDITDFVMEARPKRSGRAFELDRIDASTCALTLDNSDRRFDPTNTASPLYPYVLPMREVRVTATFLGTTYHRFRGYIERWPVRWHDPNWSQVTITAVDAFHPLSNAIIAGTFPAELTGARIDRVLTAAAWPASTPQLGGYWTLGTSALGTTTILSYGLPNKLLDQGRTVLPSVTFADTDSKSALSHMLEVADTEIGIVFVDGQGRFVFHDRHHRLKTTTSAVTFSDASPTGSKLPYADLLPSFDHDHLANDVKSTRQGGTTQTSTDVASIAKFFRHTHMRSPMLATDAEALRETVYLLRRMKDPMLRFSSMAIESWLGDVETTVGDAIWTAVLARELSDRVTVEKTPPGGGPAIVQDCYVESVEDVIVPDKDWTTQWQLSPADMDSGFWTLGTSALGTTTALAY